MRIDIMIVRRFCQSVGYCLLLRRDIMQSSTVLRDVDIITHVRAVLQSSVSFC